MVELLIVSLAEELATVVDSIHLPRPQLLLTGRAAEAMEVIELCVGGGDITYCQDHDFSTTHILCVLIADLIHIFYPHKYPHKQDYTLISRTIPSQAGPYPHKQDHTLISRTIPS